MLRQLWKHIANSFGQRARPNKYKTQFCPRSNHIWKCTLLALCCYAVHLPKSLFNSHEFQFMLSSCFQLSCQSDDWQTDCTFSLIHPLTPTPAVWDLVTCTTYTVSSSHTVFCIMGGHRTGLVCPQDSRQSNFLNLRKWGGTNKTALSSASGPV